MLRGFAGEQQGLKGSLRGLRPRDKSFALMERDDPGDSVSLCLLASPKRSRFGFAQARCVSVVQGGRLQRGG
jgi:hypothetical protein